MQIDLGGKIRQLRRKNGQTQEALAQALGVTAQAVSRWEAGGSYPDMNLIPSIANFFGVTIDELFGYTDTRTSRIQELLTEIQRLKWENNGTERNMEQTIAFARKALMEFPGNERLMVSLASVLYTAGYSWHGEHHLTDAQGYDVYDSQRHRTYPEWQEAVDIYEKALCTLEDGELRRVTVGELTQLYVNMGLHEKALALAEAAPGIYSTREYMRICACDGQERIRAYGKAILAMVHASAALVVQDVMASRDHMTAAQKAASLKNAVELFACVCPDGNYGEHHRLVARIYTLLSVYLWVEGKQEEAFEVLEHSLDHFRRFEQLCGAEDPRYTAPLVRLVEVDFSRSPIPDPEKPESTAASLYRDWPWWHVPEEESVKLQMQADPRWKQWTDMCGA